MKNEKGIALIFLVIIIIAILVISGGVLVFIVHQNTENKGETQTIADTNSSSLEENSEEVNFWINNYKNFGEQKENINLKLFDNKFDTPIDLMSADSFVKAIHYYPEYNRKTVYKMSDLLNAEDMIDSGANIYLEYGNLENEESESYEHLINLRISNFNEEDISMKECFKNNWWCMDLSSINKAFGIEPTLEEEYADKNAELNKIIDFLGGPKHIYCMLEVNDRDEGYLKDLSSIDYILLYDYGDDVIWIDVIEIASSSKTYKPHVSSIMYAPKEFWQKYLYLQEESEDFRVIK